MEMLLRIAEIISWNIFQMDGIKNVIPMSCRHEVIEKEIPPMVKLWGESPKIIKNECAGCKIMTILSIMVNMSLLWIGKKETS